MAYRVALDGPYIRVWFTGTLTAANLHDVADELRAHESKLGRAPDRLVDMSGMLATDTTFNLAILAARVRRVHQFPNDFRSALVAPKVEVAGFARIFRTLNRNPQIEVQVFADVEAAEKWLSSPASSDEPPVRRA